MKVYEFKLLVRTTFFLLLFERRKKLSNFILLCLYFFEYLWFFSYFVRQFCNKIRNCYGNANTIRMCEFLVYKSYYFSWTRKLQKRSFILRQQFSYDFRWYIYVIKRFACKSFEVVYSKIMNRFGEIAMQTRSLYTNHRMIRF